MMEGQFKRVKEATYLSTEKSETYRTILRFFYIQHERMKEFLFPEEILTHVKGYSSFHSYSIDELHVDLAALVKWGNLLAQQESVRLWRMDIDSYEKSGPSVELGQRLAKLTNIVHPLVKELIKEMNRVGKAGYQEALLERMAEDMKEYIETIE